MPIEGGTIVSFHDFRNTIGSKYAVQLGNHSIGCSWMHNLNIREPGVVIYHENEGFGVATGYGKHFLTIESTTLSILGNQTFQRYRLRVLTIPWWPSWTNSTTRFWRTLGITMQFPRSAIFPSTEISLLRTLAKILRVLVSTVVDPSWGLWSRTVQDLQQGLVTNNPYPYRC